jgi:hypothetical protein
LMRRTDDGSAPGVCVSEPAGSDFSLAEHPVTASAIAAASAVNFLSMVISPVR